MAAYGPKVVIRRRPARSIGELMYASVAKIDDSKPLAHQVSEAKPAAGAGGVLLIENNPECRAIVSHLLGGRGYRIIHAEGQDHAALLSEVTQVDLVLTNRAVFKNCSRSFTEQLRRRRPGLPLVMYSMVASAKDAEEAIRCGVSKFLSTPEEFLDLAAISASLMSKSRVAR